eukprot:6147356-Pyramimonas_sp.AAC.1
MCDQREAAAVSTIMGHNLTPPPRHLGPPTFSPVRFQNFQAISESGPYLEGSLIGVVGLWVRRPLGPQTQQILVGWGAGARPIGALIVCLRCGLNNFRFFRGLWGISALPARSRLGPRCLCHLSRPRRWGSLSASLDRVVPVKDQMQLVFAT